MDSCLKAFARSLGILTLAATVLAACGGAAAPSSAPREAASAASAAAAKPAPLASTPQQAASAASATAAKPVPSASAGPKRGGTVKVGLWQEPDTLNPVLTTKTATSIVTSSILEGLLSAQPDGTYGPRLAAQVPTKENVGVSADGLTITYKFKPGVVWSDGSALHQQGCGVFQFEILCLGGSLNVPD